MLINSQNFLLNNLLTEYYYIKAICKSFLKILLTYIFEI